MQRFRSIFTLTFIFGISLGLSCHSTNHASLFAQSPNAQSPNAQSPIVQPRTVQPITATPRVPNSKFGGITQADFQPLINLIQSTISADSWQDFGTGEGTISAYPAGVSVDTGDLKRALESRRPNDKDLRDLPAGIRRLSLKRILQEVQSSAAMGRAPSPELRNLGGVWRIQYVMFEPATRDIIIAGPAGPWETTPEGQSFNIENGQPLLQLDDLIEAFRNTSGPKTAQGKFGCSIVPRQRSLAAAQQFLNRNPAGGKRWAEQLRSVIGKQDVIVHGVSRTSHVASVLVEADLLMKQIGMGLKPSIKAVPNYFDRAEKQINNGQRDSLVRWWFTVDYDAIAMDPNRERFEFSRGSVQVLSENEHLQQNGRRTHLGQSDPATAGFAEDFSDNFDELARKYPAFAKLRNVFDLAVVAGLISQFELNQKADLNAEFLNVTGGPFNRARAVYTPAAFTPIEEVDSILNDRKRTFSKNGKVYRQHLVAVSGGVEFDFSTVLKNATVDVRSVSSFPKLRRTSSTDAWWWQ